MPLRLPNIAHAHSRNTTMSSEEEAARQQFAELQKQYVETTQKLKQLRAREKQVRVDGQRATLTAKELETNVFASSSSSSSSSSRAEEGEGGGERKEEGKEKEGATTTTTTKLYVPLGRGFVLKSRREVEDALAETARTAERAMCDAAEQITFLEGKIVEFERNLRELLQTNDFLRREIAAEGGATEVTTTTQ